MRVAELWRFPVKSLQGERVETAEVRHEGLEGDRRFAIFDVATGLGLTARREPALLHASAHLREDGGVRIVLPDGTWAPDDAALTAWLGRPVELRASTFDGPRRYENTVDFEREDTAPWRTFEGASVAFHDSERARVTLVSSASLGAWDRRRFRANIVLDGDGEDALVGRSVRLGEAVLDIGMHVSRCVMTTRAQPGGIERDLSVLRTIAREREARLSVGALVARPGVVRVGDVLVAL